MGAVGARPEMCDGLDNDWDGETDGGDPGGGRPCGQGACSPGVTTCVDGALRCTGDTRSSPETCDGLDDDCDGQTDEGDNGCGGVCVLDGMPGLACDGADLDLCPEGIWACASPNVAACSDETDDSPEECGNALDDDCDGWTDGGPIADCCVPSGPETCNAIDDDCNGDTDEICDDGDACTLADRCEGGVCAGTLDPCLAPPSECSFGPGVCSDGVCTYPSADGTPCSDGDDCTAGDTCASGVCAGAPTLCETPPDCSLLPGHCVAGVCEYVPVVDCWTTTPEQPSDPVGRERHTAIWTGKAMIVWGGEEWGAVVVSTGGEYDPATDSWKATADGPVGRADHSAIWTGSEMIVWGGRHSAPYASSSTGDRYDPSTRTWADLSSVGAPSRRALHTAVWTGTEMIVWGGLDGPDTIFNTGGRYDPITDTWTATSTVGAPDGHAANWAVWTGTEMIVWSGCPAAQPCPSSSGGRYDPASDSWRPMAAAGAPSWDYDQTVVWTGTEMIVWRGGTGGGRYNPGTDLWTSLSDDGAPLVFESPAVWTGHEMIVWGGTFGSLSWGGRYDPASDVWLPISLDGDPLGGREGHTAVWTGDVMIVWGGRSRTSDPPSEFWPTEVGRYRP